MDLFNAIDQRYSYRDKFKDTPVPKDDLIKILDAGLKAPSGKNAQTTQFIIVHDENVLQKIRDILPKKKCTDTCKAMIVCLIDNVPDAIYEGFNFQIEDCSAAVENMLLAITALGYATVWLDGALRVQNRAERIGDVLSVPKNKKVQIILPVGVPAEEGPRKEKMSFDERVWFNRYQG